MFLSFSITELITMPFGMVLDLLYRLTTNYGVAVILFSVLFSLVLHPMKVYNAVNGAKKERLRPKVLEIRAKFPGTRNQEIQTKIMGEMYDKENVSPHQGGAEVFIASIVVLMLLISAINQPMVAMLGIDKETAVGIFEIMAESKPELFPYGAYNEMIIAHNIPAFAAEIQAAYPEISARALEGINFSFLGLDLAQVPNMDIASWGTMDWAHIGLLLMPILAIIVHILPSLVSSFITAFIRKPEQKEGNKKSFDFVTPLLLLSFTVACFQVPAAMSLYWLTQSIMSLILQQFIRRKLMNLPPEVVNLDELMAPYLATTNAEVEDTSASEA